MSLVGKRDQDVYVVDENGNLVDSWYYSDQASAIKYGILFGILALGFLAIFTSWFHAHSRLKKGLAPLAYHRWLVPRHYRARFEPQPRDQEHSFSFYGRQQQQQQQQQDYYMHTVPPPVYNPNLQQPPAYPGAPPAPPAPAAAPTAGGGGGGGSKADPFHDPTEAARAPGAGGEGSSLNATPTPLPPRYS